MASNKFTSQTPLANNSVKLVLAERVYVAAVDTEYSDPAAKIAGVDTALLAGAWDDLGIVAGSKVTVSYNKETAYIETGIDKIRRGAYLRGKNAQAKFQLEQFDMTVLEAVSGLTAVNVGSIGKKLYVGQEDVVYKALLFIGTNKVDDKEHQTYVKKAALTWATAEQDDARVLDMTADFFGFDPGNGSDALYVLYILN